MRIVAPLLLIVLLAGCNDVDSLSDTRHLEKARTHIQSGKTESAVIELKNALSRNPGNAEARLLLASVYLEMGDMPGAAKELVRAGELGVSPETTSPLLARAYLVLGDFAAVLALPDGSNSFSNAARATLLTSKGIAFLNQGDHTQADELFRAALEAKPDSPYPHYGRALWSWSQQGESSARDSVADALEHDDGFGPAWALLGEMESSSSNLQAAEEAYSKAITNAPGNFTFYLGRAMTRIKLQRLDDAWQDVAEADERSPRVPQIGYLYGLISFIKEEYAAAQGYFDAVLGVNADFMPAVFFAGAAHLALGNEEQAQRYLSRFVARHPSYLPARKMLAAIELDRGEYRRAEALAKPAVDAADDDELALDLLAVAALGQNRPAEATEHLGRAAELQPQTAAAKTRHAGALLIEGRQPEAVEVLESARELDPESQSAVTLLILAHLRAQDFEKAKSTAEDFVARQPENPVAYNLLGLVHLAKSEPEKARAAFRQTLKISPGNPGASAALADFAVADAKPEDARQIYLNALEEHQNNLQILLRLAVLEARQGDVEAMKAYLEQAIAAHTESVESRVILAHIHLLEGDTNSASAVMRGIPQGHVDEPRILSVVGEIELANRNYGNARDSFQKLTELLPASAQSHFLLAQALAGLNEEARVHEELSRALELDPRHFRARVVQTRLQIRSGKLEEAKLNVAILKEEWPSSPEVLALDAALSAKAGDYAAAFSTLERRFEAAPSTNTVLALARFSLKRGNNERAIVVMKQWLEAHPGDLAVRISLANAYSALGRTDEAVTLYEEVLSSSEDSVPALNNLAWLLRETDPDKAIMLAEKAQTLAPDSVAVLGTMSELMLAKGALSEAELLNTRALAQKAGSAPLQFRQARILEAKGKTDDAVTVLRRLLSEHPVFEERAEAEAMLARLGG